jgi:hypothetical protein
MKNVNIYEFFFENAPTAASLGLTRPIAWKNNNLLPSNYLLFFGLVYVIGLIKRGKWAVFFNEASSLSISFQGNSLRTSLCYKPDSSLSVCWYANELRVIG